MTPPLDQPHVEPPEVKSSEMLVYTHMARIAPIQSMARSLLVKLRLVWSGTDGRTKRYRGLMAPKSTRLK